MTRLTHSSKHVPRSQCPTPSARIVYPRTPRSSEFKKHHPCLCLEFISHPCQPHVVQSGIIAAVMYHITTSMHPGNTPHTFSVIELRNRLLVKKAPSLFGCITGFGEQAHFFADWMPHHSINHIIWRQFSSICQTSKTNAMRSFYAGTAHLSPIHLLISLSLDGLKDLCDSNATRSS